jgi:uncharacterized LabA/DUF88 family protein
VLVDFENIYSMLVEEPETDERMDESMVDLEALDEAVEVLSVLRDRLRHRFHCVMTIGRSYADFDRLGGDAMTQLQLLSFEPRFTLAARQQSTAGILLSIDAMEMLFSRPELDTFVIVGGGRHYLPVVRRLREHMKRVLLVGFGRSTSGDLRHVVGEENFIAAETLLPSTPLQTEIPMGNGDHRREAAEPNGDGAAEGDVPADEENLERCMSELLGAYYQYGGRTVWLTPFLRILNDRFPYLDNRGRKRMVEDLQARGAIRIEKVEGDPYPYSVVEINWEDVWVRQLDEGRGNS